MDKDGKLLDNQEKFAGILRVEPGTGAVFLEQELDRNSVAVITLSVQVGGPTKLR